MTKKKQLAAYSTLMGIIMVLAYLGLIPTKLHDIPYYDFAGHFILYGFWGYFFGMAYSKHVLLIGKFNLQAGILIVLLIAVLEEFLQRLSPMRSFSLTDLSFGVSGIVLACIFLNTVQRKNYNPKE